MTPDTVASGTQPLDRSTRAQQTASRAPLRVMFWVQHLLGTGHLERVRRIAEALADRGEIVHFVTGGVPIAGRMPRDVHIVQLPPIRVSDVSFNPLRDQFLQPIDEDFRQDRARRVLAAFEEANPSIVVFETFPFGRRSLRFELFPLLEQIARTTPRPRLIASVREILQLEEVAGRDAEAWELADRWLDGILVHGDAAFARLEETSPFAARSRVPIHYTGFVTAPGTAPPRVPRDEQDEIVVSAGGGGTGTHVLEAAIHARKLSKWRDLTWRVLVGPGVAESRYRELAAYAEPGLVVERNRPDFPALLARARVSVSQAGYNTVMDVLRSGAPAVMVPFAGRRETEQRMRTERLAQLGAIDLLDERDLSPPALAAVIDRAAERGERSALAFDMDGASASATLITTYAPDR
jgi:predicted glycosyltransferase